MVSVTQWTAPTFPTRTGDARNESKELDEDEVRHKFFEEYWWQEIGKGIMGLK